MSAKKPAFLVTGHDLAPQALALLGDYEMVFAGKTPTEDDIVALCKQHDPVAIIVRYSKVGAAAMDAAPSLKVISKHGSGTDTIDKVAAEKRGIKVVAAVGANAAAVAEQALALLLACAKSVVTLNERMHAGHWDKATHKSVELEGRTVGVIGLGAIGLRFARMADAMGMRVLGFDPYAKDLPAYIENTDLATIWRESDAISLHCPLTADNAKLVNATDAGGLQEGRAHRQHRARWPDRRGRPARRRSHGPGGQRRPRQLRRRADDGAAPVPRRSPHHAQPAHRRRHRRCLREDGRGSGEERAWPC